MKYASNFDLDLLGDDIPVVKLIKNAGKAEDLVCYLERNIGNKVPTIGEIKNFIELRSSEMLHDIGLTEDGKPLDTKKYQVFLRIVSTCKQEIEAKNPEEARELARDWVWTNPDFTCLDVYRDDIESAYPVAYESPDSVETREFAPSEEEREALRRALVGNALWVLVRTWKDSCGNVSEVTTKMFIDEPSARACMADEFNRIYRGKMNGEVKCMMDPDMGGDCCYVADNDDSEMRWHLIKSALDSEAVFKLSHRRDPKWLEDRLAEAVNLFSQLRDGESVDDVTCAKSEKDSGKSVKQLMDEVRVVYPEM